MSDDSKALIMASIGSFISGVLLSMYVVTSGNDKIRNGEEIALLNGIYKCSKVYDLKTGE